MGLARQKEQHPQSRQMGERPVGGSRTGTGRGGTVKAGGAWGRKRGRGYREEELGGGSPSWNPFPDIGGPPNEDRPQLGCC